MQRYSSQVAHQHRAFRRNTIPGRYSLLGDTKSVSHCDNGPKGFDGFFERDATRPAVYLISHTLHIKALFVRVKRQMTLDHPATPCHVVTQIRSHAMPNIELTLEHTDAHGDMVETLIDCVFTYQPGYRATWEEPGAGAEWGYVSATWRDEKGVWRPVGGFLETWTIAKLNALDQCDIEACVPSGPDPDAARDARMDREMNR
jgi:hypothetical protein